MHRAPFLHWIVCLGWGWGITSGMILLFCLLSEVETILSRHGIHQNKNSDNDRKLTIEEKELECPFLNFPHEL